MEEQTQGNFTPLPPLVTEPTNNLKTIEEKPKILRGFNTHPENINRNGAPLKAWRWGELVDTEVEEEIEAINSTGVKVKWKKKKAIVKKLVSLAMNGDVHAIMGIIEMKDGKPKQGLQLEGEIGIRPIVYKPSKLKVK